MKNKDQKIDIQEQLREFQVILASASPQRHSILSKTNIPFLTKTSSFPETLKVHFSD
jgi:predicted house-cleaning NTP pyrophosphatase (Maf/HAM1 superfamily)